MNGMVYGSRPVDYTKVVKTVLFSSTAILLLGTTINMLKNVWDKSELL
jgi:hypothetical protein